MPAIKYLGPYERNGDLTSFVWIGRKRLGSPAPNYIHSPGSVYLDNDLVNWWHSFHPSSAAPFTTKEAAMEDLDNNLISMGYILLTAEQVEKLKCLL